VADGEAPRPDRLRRARRGLTHLALLLAAVALLLLAAGKMDPAVLGRDLAKLDAGTIGLAFVAYLAAWSLRVWRLHLLARAAGTPLPWGQSTATTLGANALNIVAPARLGDVAAFLHLRCRSGQGPAAAATILTWRLSDLGALLAFALVAGIPMLLLVPLPDGSGLLWAMAAGAAFLLLAALGAQAARHQRVRALLDRLARRLLGPRAPLGAAFGQATARLWAPKVFTAGLLLAAGGWACDALLAGTILHALWPGNAYAVVVLPMILANVAKTLPSTPGGVGVYEAIYWATLQHYGIDSATAFTAALATHFLMNAWTLVLGIPGMVAIGRSVDRAMAR
jgi:uncharacterized membrane protein YbhN (UPF0104 family)